MIQEKTIFIATACLNVALRTWMKDKETFVVNNVFEVKKLAEKLGLSLFQCREMERNINDFVTQFAERLYNSHMMEGFDEERKNEILDQILKDFSSMDFSEQELIKSVLDGENLKKQIEEKSKENRKYWSEKENGEYANCVRFAVEAVEAFVTGLPTFTPSAIKILYKRDSEAFEKIAENLDEIMKIISSRKSTTELYREFETDYLLEIRKQYRKIEIFGSGLNRNIKRYNISTAYLDLRCSDKEDGDITQKISRVIANNNIVWISGEAGGGKTTFIQWLATCDISEEQAISELEGLIPIVIKLRNVTFPINVKKEIEKTSSLSCPDKWIDYLVKNDKILLLIDGMDEVSEYDRSKVYNFVEDIIENLNENPKKKPRSRIVITARPYIEDALCVEHRKYELLRMDMHNIEEFVLYWYRTILNVDDDAAKAYADKLMVAIKNNSNIKSIVGTPLLCAMVCALNYVNNESIPTNRNELYEKCCQMLIESRDKERQIEVAALTDLDKLDYTKKSIILSVIARHMVEVEKVEIEKEEILSIISRYITNSTIIGSKDIEEKPELLVDYLIQRTGVIREPDKGTIDFIHKTFLEYLSAKAIVRDEEWFEVEKNLVNPFWKDTIIMCFGQLNQDKASRLLETLMKHYEDEELEEYLFMAALCANNSTDIRVDIDRSITNEIEKRIPPSAENVRRLKDAGAYILPFLKNKTC